ncbi:MAG: methyltransferase domain-containing protein [bacterium]
MDALQETMPVNTEYGLSIFEKLFYGYNIEEKRKYLRFNYVQKFIQELNELSAGLGNILSQIFLTAQFSENWDTVKQQVIDLGGFIGPVLRKNPGSFQFMDLLYRCEAPKGPLDRFLMDCHSGRAVDHRKNATIQNIIPLLAQIQNGHGRKKVLNLGSGCGYDTFEMSAGNDAISEQVNFINVDIDPAAIAKGEKFLQKRYQHLTNISFLLKDMLRLKVRDAVVALIIGVLCSFPREQSVRNLHIVKSFISPRGIVYGACVTDRMVREDLFTSFILEYILGWHLCYRTLKDVQDIFESAGYIWRRDLTFTEEPTEFYVIGAGEVPNK